MDVDAGRVVKGTRFIDIRDAGDPVELAAFYDREGADELVFLDITATSDKRATVVELARRAADEVFVPFTIGGGVREVADAQAVLDAGADKVVGQLRGGRAAGARGGARAACSAPSASCWRSTPSGARTAAGRCSWPAAARRRAATRSPGRARASQRGAGEILLTSMDRDGTQDGYDLDAHARDRRRRRRAGDRVGRRGRAGAHGRRLRGRRRRRARRVDLPLRPVLGRARSRPHLAAAGVARPALAAPASRAP